MFASRVDFSATLKPHQVAELAIVRGASGVVDDAVFFEPLSLRRSFSEGSASLDECNPFVKRFCRGNDFDAGQAVVIGQCPSEQPFAVRLERVLLHACEASAIDLSAAHFTKRRRIDCADPAKSTKSPLKRTPSVADDTDNTCAKRPRLTWRSAGVRLAAPLTFVSLAGAEIYSGTFRLTHTLEKVLARVLHNAGRAGKQLGKLIYGSETLDGAVVLGEFIEQHMPDLQLVDESRMTKYTSDDGDDGAAVGRPLQFNLVFYGPHVFSPQLRVNVHPLDGRSSRRLEVDQRGWVRIDGQLETYYPKDGASPDVVADFDCNTTLREHGIAVWTSEEGCCHLAAASMLEVLHEDVALDAADCPHESVFLVHSVQPRDVAEQEVASKTRLVSWHDWMSGRAEAPKIVLLDDLGEPIAESEVHKSI